MEEKFKNLKNYLKKLERQGVCLAFSGGTDSALLLHICSEIHKQILSEKQAQSHLDPNNQTNFKNNFFAITFKSEFQTEEEIEFCRDFAQEYGVNHDIIEISNLNNPAISNNPKDRCYHCKKGLFARLKEFAAARNLKAIIDGTNFDDLSCYRPGLKALEELNIISPFAEFQITKSEIREYARLLGLKIHSKPSAPCLATRFPYNTPLNTEDLAKVKSAEKFLRKLGFENCRLRLHADIARIEIPTEKFKDFLSKKTEINENLRYLNFKYITLDLSGLKSGSMDI